MPLHPNSKELIDALEALALLDGRFQGMTLVNYDSASGVQRGCFSLVFRAIDSLTGETVALKFFDPQALNDIYRHTAFQREHDLLRQLVNTERCLQLVGPLAEYQLKIPTAGSSFVVLPCNYFAVQWIPDQIDEYFFRQENFQPLDKLELFDQILNGVAALHSKGIFHRDLKPDNMRRSNSNKASQVVAIDLGTAARADSSPMLPAYAIPVGAGAYAAPEAHCRLSGNRLLGKFTDIYALGCMLFELFNKDYHINAVLARNVNYTALLTAIATQIDPHANEKQQKLQLEQSLNKFAGSIVPVPINGAGSDVPPGIAPLLNEALTSLANFDYRKRPAIAWARQKIRSAAKVLANDAIYRDRLEAVRRRRLQRLAKLKAREDRLEAALAARLKG